MRRIDLTSHWDGAGKFLKVSERRREARDIRVRGLSSRHGQTALTGCAVRRSDSRVAESPRDAHLSRGASRRARRERRLDEGDLASRGRRGEQPRPQYLDVAACARREGGREPLHRDGAGARLSIRRRGDDGRRGTRARHRRGAGRVAGDPCGRAREHGAASDAAAFRTVAGRRRAGCCRARARSDHRLVRRQEAPGRRRLRSASRRARHRRTRSRRRSSTARVGCRDAAREPPRAIRRCGISATGSPKSSSTLSRA